MHGSSKITLDICLSQWQILYQLLNWLAMTLWPLCIRDWTKKDNKKQACFCWFDISLGAGPSTDLLGTGAKKYMGPPPQKQYENRKTVLRAIHRGPYCSESQENIPGCPPPLSTALFTSTLQQLLQYFTKPIQHIMLHGFEIKSKQIWSRQDWLKVA